VLPARNAWVFDPRRRGDISAFAQISPVAVAGGLERLARDLRSGAWQRRFRALRTCETLDA